MRTLNEVEDADERDKGEKLTIEAVLEIFDRFGISKATRDAYFAAQKVGASSKNAARGIRSPAE